MELDFSRCQLFSAHVASVKRRRQSLFALFTNRLKVTQKQSEYCYLQYMQLVEFDYVNYGNPQFALRIFTIQIAIMRIMEIHNAEQGFIDIQIVLWISTMRNINIRH